MFYGHTNDMTEKEWLNEFGPRLARAIFEAGYNQEEFAEAIKVSPSTVSKYINGIQLPGVKAMINISYVLKTDIQNLVDFGKMIE